MNQSSVEVPEIQILHDRNIDFKRVIQFKNPDGTLRDITEVDLIFEISIGGIDLVISGDDIEKTEHSEFIITKAKSFFSAMDGLLTYKFKVYDAASELETVFLKGEFKVL